MIDITLFPGAEIGVVQGNTFADYDSIRARALADSGSTVDVMSLQWAVENNLGDYIQPWDVVLAGPFAKQAAVAGRVSIESSIGWKFLTTNFLVVESLSSLDLIVGNNTLQRVGIGLTNMPFAHVAHLKAMSGTVEQSLAAQEEDHEMMAVDQPTVTEAVHVGPELMEKFLAVVTPSIEANRLVGRQKRQRVKNEYLPNGKPVVLRLRPDADKSRLLKRQYKPSMKDKYHLDADARDLLARGVTEPVRIYDVNSPRFIVKGHGKRRDRACLDYRLVNLETLDVLGGAPLMDGLVDWLIDRVIGKPPVALVTAVDMSRWFHQISVDKRSRELLTFTGADGEPNTFTTLAFGIKQAPAIAQAVLNNILSGLESLARGYIDDVIIASRAEEVTPEVVVQHAEDVKRVMDRLTEANAALNLNKSLYACTSLKVLGTHIATGKHAGRGIDPAKVKEALLYKRPTTGKHVKQFLAFVSFLRANLPGYAHLSGVLSPLEKFKSKRLGPNWEEKHTVAFQKIKDLVNKQVVIRSPLPDVKLILAVDASQEAVGGVLYQLDPVDQRVRLIRVVSKQLGGARRNWCAHKRESYAVYYALTKCHDLVYGLTAAQLELHTDHQSLSTLWTAQKLSYSQQDWLAVILTYQCTVVYVKGEINVLADSVSRQFPPYSPTPGESGETVPAVTTAAPTEVVAAMSATTQRAISGGRTCFDCGYCEESSVVQSAELSALELPDQQLDEAIPHARRELERHIRERFSKSLPRDDKHKQELVDNMHKQAHQGAQKLYIRLYHAGWFWPEMFTQCRKRVATCLACQKHSILRTGYAPLTPPETASAPWIIVNADLGEMSESKSKHKYFLVVKCRWSKFMWTAPLLDKRAVTVAAAFQDCVDNLGYFHSCIADNGTEFLGETTELFKQLNTERRFITAHHPEANGAAENAVKLLKRAMIRRCDQDFSNWPRELSQVTRALNETPTVGNHCPFTLFFGRAPRPESKLDPNAGGALEPMTEPTDEVVAANLAGAKRVREVVTEGRAGEREELINAHRKKRKGNRAGPYKVGDVVLTKKTGLGSKGEPNWIGPRTIVRVGKKKAYGVEISPGNVINVPEKYIKLLPNVGTGPGQTATMMNGQGEEVPVTTEDLFPARAILGERQVQDQFQYKVDWGPGYSPTWELANGCSDLLVAAYQKQKRTKANKERADRNRAQRKTNSKRKRSSRR